MTTEPLRVLFVCTANICRSAYAEVVARSLVADGSIAFASAGIHGWRDHPLEAEMAAVLPPGVSADGFASRPLTAAMVDEADLVLTMEAAQRTYLLTDHPGAFKKVFTLGQAARVLERLRAEGGAGGEGAAGGEGGAVRPDRATLLRRLGAARGTADPALDVTDPYRRGPAAAEEAARRIRELLDAVLPALRVS